MLYLIDTNIWIEVLKGRNARLIRRFAATPVVDLAACAPVRAGLMHGAEKYRDTEARERDVIHALGKIVSLPFDDRCTDRYGVIRHDLEMKRCVIGPMDMLIAAIALAHGLILVTGNVDEFSRVPGLNVEDWSA